MVLKKKGFLFTFVLTLVILFSSSSYAVGPRGAVPEIEITRVKEKPVIDGDLTDETWIEIAKSFKGVLSGWKNQKGTAIIKNQRIAFIGYDDEALYVGMICYVDDVDSLRYGNEVWYDDSLEIHLENADGEYFQMGITCGGEWDIGRLDKIFRFEGASMIGDNYWSTEVAIPWKEIRVTPKYDTEIGFNLAGNDYIDYWITWGPSYGSFQRPETFSYLILK